MSTDKPGLLHIKGDEYHGKNPKDLSPKEWKQINPKHKTPLAALRARCVDCCGGVSSEVLRCVAVNCPSWPFRMGNNPFSGDVSGDGVSELRAQVRAEEAEDRKESIIKTVEENITKEVLAEVLLRIKELGEAPEPETNKKSTTPKKRRQITEEHRAKLRENAARAREARKYKPTATSYLMCEQDRPDIPSKARPAIAVKVPGSDQWPGARREAPQGGGAQGASPERELD